MKRKRKSFAIDIIHAGAIHGKPLLSKVPVDGTSSLSCKARLYYYRLLLPPLLYRSSQINIIRNPVFSKVPTFTDGCERGDRLKSFISIQSESVMSPDEYARHPRFWVRRWWHINQVRRIICAASTFTRDSPTRAYLGRTCDQLPRTFSRIFWHSRFSSSLSSFRFKKA